MTNPVESLLENDHRSLGKLFAELDAELAESNVSRAFELLDLFWARLAVHIRAENLHLFPQFANISAISSTGRAGVPSPEEAQNMLSRLRSDHDFFMKELADMIKAMREMVGSQQSCLEELKKWRQRLTLIKERLDQHNQLEEKQVYLWPALIFDEQRITRLCERLHHELNNLPPRLQT
jgi:hypothetical protein